VERLSGLVEGIGGECEPLLSSDEDERERSDVGMELVCKLYSEVYAAESQRNTLRSLDNGGTESELDRCNYLQFSINFNLFLVVSIFGFSITVVRKIQDILLKVES
jgi:hypothetical protein